MLRFSVNLSLIFQEMALLERIQAARDYGFRAVEIQFPYQRSAAEIQQALQKPVDQRRWVMVIDLRKCVGCHGCTVSCVADSRGRWRGW